MALLRRLLPRIHKHLQQVGVGPLLYLPEWFLCLFARSLPFPTVLRIWDAFLSEGEWGSPAVGPGALGCPGELADQLQVLCTQELLLLIPLRSGENSHECNVWEPPPHNEEHPRKAKQEGPGQGCGWGGFPGRLRGGPGRSQHLQSEGSTLIGSAPQSLHPQAPAPGAPEPQTLVCETFLLVVMGMEGSGTN